MNVYEYYFVWSRWIITLYVARSRAPYVFFLPYFSKDGGVKSNRQWLSVSILPICLVNVYLLHATENNWEVWKEVWLNIFLWVDLEFNIVSTQLRIFFSPNLYTRWGGFMMWRRKIRIFFWEIYTLACYWSLSNWLLLVPPLILQWSPFLSSKFLFFA